MKSFEDYLREGVAKRQSPSPSRSRALLLEAEDSYRIIRQFLAAMPLSDENANHVVKNAYDIIMELIRSKMADQGYTTSGQGAHEAEVAYLERLGLPALKREFADRLRYYRNGILYFGKSFDAEYARKVLAFLDELRKLIKEKRGR